MELVQTLTKSKMVRTLMNNLGNIAFSVGEFEYLGSYDPNSGIIKVCDHQWVYDFIILEEMVHKLQHNNNSIRFGENNNKLNIEVEAKILVFLYNQKYPTNESIAQLIGGNDDMWLQYIDNYLEKPSEETYQTLVNYFRSECTGYDSSYKDHPSYRHTNNINAYIEILRKETNF